jgi:DNA (cytosine-5)-methyltransferase 1
MNNKCIRFGLEPLPHHQDEAVQWLLVLVRATDGDTLRDVSAAEFKRGWYAVGFLYPGLHPDGALDHGEETSDVAQDIPEIRQIEPRLLAPKYVESGWPVILAPVAAEAWRRYESGQLADGEFYCSEAVIAGLCFYNPALADRVRIERERIIDTPSTGGGEDRGE